MKLPIEVSADIILGLKANDMSRVILDNMEELYYQLLSVLDRHDKLSESNKHLQLYRKVAECDVAEFKRTGIVPKGCKTSNIDLKHLPEDLALDILRKYVNSLHIMNMPTFEITPARKAILDTMPSNVYVSIKPFGGIAHHVDTVFDPMLVEKSVFKVLKSSTEGLWYLADNSSSPYFNDLEYANAVCSQVTDVYHAYKIEYERAIFDLKMGTSDDDYLLKEPPVVNYTTAEILVPNDEESTGYEVVDMYQDFSVKPGVVLATWAFPSEFENLHVHYNVQLRMMRSHNQYFVNDRFVHAAHRSNVEKLLRARNAELTDFCIKCWLECVSKANLQNHTGRASVQEGNYILLEILDAAEKVVFSKLFDLPELVKKNKNLSKPVDKSSFDSIVVRAVIEHDLT